MTEKSAKGEEGSPRVSVLMPTFNVGDYVEEAVDSILNQTMSDFELIVVDDCSSDATFDVLQGLAESDERIRLFRNDRNLRIAKTLNYALSKARGSYIVRMDGDDISRSDRFAKLLDFLDRNPSCGLVGSYTTAIAASGAELARRRQPRSDKWISRTLPLCSTVSHIWMARKSLYDELGGYRNVPGAEDYDFLLRAKYCGYEVANYPDYLYKVRLREGNTESTQGLERVLTKEFVFRMVKEGEEFDESSLAEYLNANARDKEKYQVASAILNKAKHERNAPLQLVIDVARAALHSRYVARYLFEVTAVRAAVKLEDLANRRVKGA